MKINDSILKFLESKNREDFNEAKNSIKEEMRVSKLNLHLLVTIEAIENIKETLAFEHGLIPWARENLSIMIHKNTRQETQVEFINNTTKRLDYNVNDYDLQIIDYNLKLSSVNMYEYCGTINETSENNPIVIKMNQDMDILYDIYLNKESLNSLALYKLQKDLNVNDNPTRKIKV